MIVVLVVVVVIIIIIIIIIIYYNDCSGYNIYNYVNDNKSNNYDNNININ
jgi:hypothetical protein